MNTHTTSEVDNTIQRCPDGSIMIDGTIVSDDNLTETDNQTGGYGEQVGNTFTKTDK